MLRTNVSNRNVEGALDFKIKLARILEEEKYGPSQIFNADETGLNFKMLPGKTLAVRKNHGAAGFKKNKERLTIMACTNADASLILPLVVIGKSKNPRALKNISHDSLPVIYTHQTSAWMNSTIFEAWFRNKFAPQVRAFLLSKNLLPKAILLVDNAGCHPKDLVDGQIRVVFLPPNTTSIIQPLDQGIIENLKKNYRYHFLSAIIKAQDTTGTLIDHIKKITIRAVIQWVAQSWDEVSQLTIIKCWKPLIPLVIFKELQKNEPQQTILLQHFINAFLLLQNSTGLTENDIEEWINNADKEKPKNLSDEEIVDMLHIHTSNETAAKFFPIELLPNESGGKAGSLMELHAKNIKRLEANRDWFLEDEQTMRVNEALRPGKQKTATDLFGVEGSFKKNPLVQLEEEKRKHDNKKKNKLRRRWSRIGLPRGYLRHMRSAHADRNSDTRKLMLEKTRKLLQRMIEKIDLDKAADEKW
nr:PREDICTED: jerky protein homolog-like [Fopius arisanus]